MTAIKHLLQDLNGLRHLAPDQDGFMIWKDMKVWEVSGKETVPVPKLQGQSLVWVTRELERDVIREKALDRYSFEPEKYPWHEGAAFRTYIAGKYDTLILIKGITAAAYADGSGLLKVELDALNKWLRNRPEVWAEVCKASGLSSSPFKPLKS